MEASNESSFINVELSPSEQKEEAESVELPIENEQVDQEQDQEQETGGRNSPNSGIAWVSFEGRS